MSAFSKARGDVLTTKKHKHILENLNRNLLITPLQMALPPTPLIRDVVIIGAGEKSSSG